MRILYLLQFQEGSVGDFTYDTNAIKVLSQFANVYKVSLGNLMKIENKPWRLFKCFRYKHLT